jgi:hypothetical protein
VAGSLFVSFVYPSIVPLNWERVVWTCVGATRLLFEKRFPVTELTTVSCGVSDDISHSHNQNSPLRPTLQAPIGISNRNNGDNDNDNDNDDPRENK